MSTYNSPKFTKFTDASDVYKNACKLRDACKAAMNHPDLVEYEIDPGDAQVCINGNDHNASRVLGYLAAIGVPSCT